MTRRTNNLFCSNPSGISFCTTRTTDSECFDHEHVVLATLPGAVLCVCCITQVLGHLLPGAPRSYRDWILLPGVSTRHGLRRCVLLLIVTLVRNSPILFFVLLTLVCAILDAVAIIAVSQRPNASCILQFAGQHLSKYKIQDTAVSIPSLTAFLRALKYNTITQVRLRVANSVLRCV